MTLPEGAFPPAVAGLVEAEVVGVEDVGAYRLLRLRGEGLDPGSPGRFMMVRDPDGDAYLPRPVGAFALPDGTVGVLIDPSYAVGDLARAARLLVLGPLGRGYDLVGADAGSTLLVGGGIGMTTLVGVPGALGGEPRLFAGFRSAAHAAITRLLPGEATIAIAPDFITGAVEAALADGGVRLVLASGPGPMVGAVAEACAAAGVLCQAALEAPMACGFGACFGCAVRLDGEWRRLCIDGPVVDAARLR